MKMQTHANMYTCTIKGAHKVVSLHTDQRAPYIYFCMISFNR